MSTSEPIPVDPAILAWEQANLGNRAKGAIVASGESAPPSPQDTEQQPAKED